jgi:hypothetical protein
MNDADDLWFDPVQAVVLVAIALFAALLFLQYRLIIRTDGRLRWLAAAPSLILAAFVLLNVVAPSNMWPIALVFWTVIAFAVHSGAWFLVRLLRRPV